ncbi:hypothetical protein HDU67_001664 [Dinochytrium kinnereticum]|nr:hypothetical protein HDU67_001664 [Dinochytrium kinnereticum]
MSRRRKMSSDKGIGGGSFNSPANVSRNNVGGSEASRSLAPLGTSSGNGEAVYQTIGATTSIQTGVASPVHVQPFSSNPAGPNGFAASASTPQLSQNAVIISQPVAVFTDKDTKEPLSPVFSIAQPPTQVTIGGSYEKAQLASGARYGVQTPGLLRNGTAVGTRSEAGDALPLYEDVVVGENGRRIS